VLIQEPVVFEADESRSQVLQALSQRGKTISSLGLFESCWQLGDSFMSGWS